MRDKIKNIKYMTEYRKTHKNYRLRSVLYSRETRFKIMSLISNKNLRCVCCGEDEYKFLTIDHKLDNGAKERKELKLRSLGNIKFLMHISKNSNKENYQILCWNCNCAKHYWGICPHQKKRMELFGV